MSLRPKAPTPLEVRLREANQKLRADLAAANERIARLETVADAVQAFSDSTDVNELDAERAMFDALAAFYGASGDAVTAPRERPMADPEQDAEIVQMQDDYHACWRLKQRWIVVDNGDGTYTVHQHTADSVYPPTDYPTKRLAAARLLQLLGLGPVGPQSHPEDVCVDLPSGPEGGAATPTGKGETV